MQRCARKCKSTGNQDSNLDVWCGKPIVIPIAIRASGMINCEMIIYLEKLEADVFFETIQKTAILEQHRY